LTKNAEGFVDGVRFRDTESGTNSRPGQVVIKRYGPFVDGVRRMADEGLEPWSRESGIHLVFDSSFFRATAPSWCRIPATGG